MDLKPYDTFIFYHAGKNDYTCERQNRFAGSYRNRPSNEFELIEEKSRWNEDDIKEKICLKVFIANR